MVEDKRPLEKEVYYNQKNNKEMLQYELPPNEQVYTIRLKRSDLNLLESKIKSGKVKEKDGVCYTKDSGWYFIWPKHWGWAARHDGYVYNVEISLTEDQIKDMMDDSKIDYIIDENK